MERPEGSLKRLGCLSVAWSGPVGGLLGLIGRPFRVAWGLLGALGWPIVRMQLLGRQIGILP
eukprot:9210500-Pyramimonas_sp.AAC.1